MRWLGMLASLCLILGALGVRTPVEAVDVWITSGDKTRLLAQQDDVVFQPGSGSGNLAISVSPNTTFQTISGVGAAMTDSSAWLLQNRMNATQRDKLMRQLFSPSDGIGVNYLRVPMGASDFTASTFYTYNDNPPGGTDEFQQHFSVAHDQAYIIPRLQQARALNPELRMMASPWSAPAWMKTNNSLTGGSLRTQWEASYARYFVKFLQAYDAAGLPMDAVTLQNEPLHTSDYPTMFMSAAQQIRFIKNHVGPQFAAQGISTKILAYDHNWDNTDYPIQVLNDPVARQYVAGTAFHAYAGDVSAQSVVHNAHPDKGIYFTEISGGDWAANFSDNLIWNFQNIMIGGMRNWSKTALLWNLALDESNGPHRNGCSNCRGVVTINSASGAVTFNEEFYVLGQVTRGIATDAVRVQSTSLSQVPTVAVVNPDGSRGLIALNPNDTASTIRVVESGRHFVYQLPARSVATFRWNGDGADFDNGGFDGGGFHRGGGSLDAWRVFGNTQGNVAASNELFLDGQTSLRLRGQFAVTSNTSGVSQGISVTPGDALRARASVLLPLFDSIVGTDNVAEIKIEFYRDYGAAPGSASFISEQVLRLADGTNSTGIWTTRFIDGVTPPDAVEARIVLQIRQPNGQTGSVHVDRAHLGLVCDFDGENGCDPQDLDLLVARIAAGSTDAATFDLNGDGLVTQADINDPELGWLRRVGERNLGPGRSYLEGDANLDGIVDGSDFGAWNSHKFTAAAWSRGDFNADGLVDGSDFGIWNGRKFSSALAASAVPEPILSGAACWGFTLFLMLRRVAFLVTLER